MTRKLIITTTLDLTLFLGVIELINLCLAGPTIQRKFGMWTSWTSISVSLAYFYFKAFLLRSVVFGKYRVCAVYLTHSSLVTLKQMVLTLF